jgi:hypothetical protein
MAFGGEVDYRIDPLLAEHTGDIPRGGDIAMDEGVTGVIPEIGQILDIAGIGQGIQINHFILRMGPEDQTNEVAADEPSSACDENSHVRSPFFEGSVYKGATVPIREQTE